MTASRTATTTTRRWLSLAATCTAAGLVWLAFADFAVATPTIAAEMNTGQSDLQWANNAFSLMAGALVIAAGKFGDMFGPRRILMIGTLVFAVCSIVAALAPGVSALIVGRGLMGIGAALILPATLALIPLQFSGASELTAFGIWQAVAWGGQALAPSIGGVLTDGLGWRWLFWVNVPIAIVVLVVIKSATPESAERAADHRIDWPGLATIGLAVFALLYALTDGPVAGWSSPLVIGLFVAAAILAVTWVLIERRVSAPLVDLSLFRLRAYDGALTANLVMNLAYGGLSYVLVLWLQSARGYSAVQAGLLMLPAVIGIFGLIPVGGRMDKRVGGRAPVLVGLVVLAVGIAILGPLHADSSLLLVMGALVVVGGGLGLLSTPVSNTTVGEVPGRLSGTAAGVFKMSSMVGGAIGVALLSAITRSLTIADSHDAVADSGMTPPEIDQAHAALVNSTSYADALSRLPSELQKKVTDAVVVAFSHGLGMTMIVTAILIVLTIMAVWFIWPRARSAQDAVDATES